MEAIKQAAAQIKDDIKTSTYNWLMANCAEKEVGDLIARMLASQVAGIGDMPRGLGLGWDEFVRLMQRLFPSTPITQFAHYGRALDQARGDEHAELYTLFLSHTEGDRELATRLADILVAGCMGGDHLWQDMGLWSRKDLSALIATSFKPLAEKNIHDMKWKKFFYKQLCIQEGVYTCRAPSCQQCADYEACFGPE